MQRLDLLIRQARTRSGNTKYGDKQGISQRSYVAYANDAQQRIYNLIMQCRPTLFVKQGTISTVAGQASYDLPTDVYLKHNIITVQFTPNGNEQLYYPLAQNYARNEVSVRALPESYFLRDGKLILTPTPMNGYANALRLTYQYIIPQVDIRRAKVADIDGSNITLVDDAMLLQETEADLSEGWVDFICLVDSNGVVLDRDLPVLGYNSTTKIISGSVDPATVPGGTIYVVFGAYASTHSSLLDVAERYIVEYMTLRSQASDTSSEVGVTSQVLKMIEAEIIDAIESLEEDIFQVPILDTQFLNYADDWEV